MVERFITRFKLPRHQSPLTRSADSFRFGHESDQYPRAFGTAFIRGGSAVSYHQQHPIPKLVAVFERTGTGKTSFIEDVAGQSQGLGHHLSPCKLHAQI